MIRVGDIKNKVYQRKDLQGKDLQGKLRKIMSKERVIQVRKEMEEIGYLV